MPTASTLAVMFLCAGSQLGALPAPPNVLLIVSDDQGWTDFGFMGNETIRTPNLDRLASQGLVFPNAYVTTPLCRPSLATILTGRYPHQHGICCNDPPAGTERSAEYHFIRDAATIPRLLQKAGYRSFQTGKFWEGHHSNAGFTDGMTEKGRHGDAGLTIGRETLQPIYDFIESCGRTPFFVWYAPMLPHAPHNPPERILARYRGEGRSLHVARYQAMCEWFDETCGQLLDYLDRKGLADNTLVVLVTDNGWIQDEDSARSVRSKLTPYDAGLRTPIVLRWPGHIEPRRVPAFASSIDLAPTILAACRVEPPRDLPGMNLRRLIRENTTREAVFGEVFLHTAIDSNKPATNLTHRWIRAGQWKMILPKDRRGAELYDVVADPAEKKDLAAREPAQVQRLTAMLDQWWRP